jgi:D-alanyl-D-alanine dipeptidase
VFDAYRPWSVTRLMWELTPPARRGFVADPARGSNHDRGFAVEAHEWWHFNHRDSPRHRIEDVPFDRLPPAGP